MECMSDLVDRLGLVSCQFALVIDGFFLQKVPDLVARSKKIFISYVVSVAGREFGEGVIVQDELVKELLGASQQGINILGGYEFRNNEISDPDIQLCSV